MIEVNHSRADASGFRKKKVTNFFEYPFHLDWSSVSWRLYICRGS